MDNKFKNVKIEYHILQTFPVTCLNRDDVGSPKSAIVGGVKRARVSSQCWKRQVRLALHDSGVRIAVRTKHVQYLILEEYKKKYGTCDADVERKAKVISDALSDDTLLFFSTQEAEKLADFIKMNEVPEESKDEKKSKASTKNLAKDLSKYLRDENKDKKGLDGLDIALFGRMVAKASSLDVEGAASFSHAITTHKVSSEVDFFTAVDDKIPDDCSGSGHLGAIEFSSGTFYRYVSLNLGVLCENLGNEDDVEKAVEAFTKALYSAVPSARQRTLAGYCPWDYAHVYVRRGQEMQLSFDAPVKPNGNGYLSQSVSEMENKLERNKSLMGSLFGELGEYVYGDSEQHGIDGLVSKLSSLVKEQQ